MDKIPENKDIEGRAKRVYVRIPKKFPAKIFLNSTFYKEILVEDLSSTGIALCIGESEKLPGSFDISFKLNFFSRPIKIRLEVKNRIKIPGGWRIGCRFLEISDRDNAVITGYIAGYLNISVPVRVVTGAAFLCLLDSLWRIFACFLYYAGSRFEEDPGLAFLDYFYLIVLLCYAGISLEAFIFAGQIKDIKGKLRFIKSLVFLSIAFIFISVKSILYWKLSFFNPEQGFFSILFWAYAFFAIYIAASLGRGIASVSKIDAVLNTLGQHKSRFQSA